MFSGNDGAWHYRPEYEVEDYQVKKTWTGPLDSQLYGHGLTALCDRTKDNLNRISQHMQKMDPCLEYGIKHWHPTTRPKSGTLSKESCDYNKPARSLAKEGDVITYTAAPRVERPQTPGRWENRAVMFTDNRALDAPSIIDDDTESITDPPAPATTFCYLCSTLEEHKLHMLHHKPKKRPVSAKPRVHYIAPRPKVKRKEETDEKPLVKERLYRVEVYTSNVAGAGTDANVSIAIKGSIECLPTTPLVKKQGCSKHCFMRESKEVFHIKGPFLGNVQILTIEHDGKDKKQAWHLEKVEITDVKALKTWVFHCNEWLSIYHKPLYSNRVDLQSEEKDRPLTEYSIEIHTGKQKMAGTDSNIFITLFGRHGNSKKIQLVDPSANKKLFEKNSIDHFRVRMLSVGELKKIRIEHDGKGFASGWFFDKAIITSSEDTHQKYYFTYGGWIAKDEGDGKLWREINAKKTLPKELKHGTETKYVITTKTGDVRFAGTDANVFIQMVGTGGSTNKIKLDDSKNNFERKMVDNFEVNAVNVGPLKHIVIGHDGANPGAGWFLDTVTVRRYVPKDEALKRVKEMKKRLSAKKKAAPRYRHSSDEESDLEISEQRRDRYKFEKERRKREKEKSGKRKDNIYTVSSDSSDSSSDDESSSRRDRQRPASALRRKNEKENNRRRRRSSSASSDTQRPSSATSRSLSERRVSTSASSQRRQQLEEKGKGKNKKDLDDDDLQRDIKLPMYEEYSFVCRKWLADDEDDGLIVRELPVEKKSTYYKE